MEILNQNFGDLVLCDMCNADWTERTESGGFVFGSKGVCPDCAPKTMKSIHRYEEEAYIKANCPIDRSFAEFIREFRGGPCTRTIMTGSIEEIFGAMVGKPGDDE